MEEKGFSVAKVIKKAPMSNETFAELMESAKQALAYERGARAGYGVTQVNVIENARTTSVSKAGLSQIPGSRRRAKR
jgi:hypothetical protein